MARAEDEGFLSRWARRKAQETRAEEVRQEDRAAGEGRPEEAAAGASPPHPPEPAEASPPEEPAEPLPDPDTLGRDADWTRFLKSDVPAELRARALRRLWRLDPVFANLDGLVDYAEDYNDPKLLAKPVRTLYQVGRGMFAPEAPPATEPGEGAALAEGPARIAGEPESEPECQPESDGDRQGDSGTETAAPAAAADELPQAADTKNPSEVPPEAVTGEEEPFREAVMPPARLGRSALARRWGATEAAEPRKSKD